MSEWIKYTGSDEQIAEIVASRNGVKLRYVNGNESSLMIRPATEWQDHSHVQDCIKDNLIDYYLICNPHPLADMICQQARTGQEVWVLEPVVGTEEHPLWPRLLAAGISRENVGTVITENGIFCQYSTHTPYWHIPDTQYSFTRIGGYRANK